MYDERSERTMPVNTAMNSAIGTESTPSRRIWVASRGSQVPTSARARPASMLRRPTCAMKPSRAGSRAIMEGNTGGIKRGSGAAGKQGRHQRGSGTAGPRGRSRVLGLASSVVPAQQPSCPAAPLSCCEAGQGAPYFPLAQPLQCPVAQLTDSFPGHAEHASDLLKGMLASAIQTEVQPQHLGIAGRQGSQG